MFEYRGWIVLAFDGYEEDFSKLKDGVAILSKRINIHKNIAQFSQIINSNESYELLMVGNLNHENGFLEDLKSLLNYVKEILPASYGLLFLRNQENEDFDKFSVLRMSKKGIELLEDTLLSPCSEFIED
ncbi:Imm7 family immunity protein [Chryseobacterium takakiae]|uniref:Immunity protein 7 n=1 Tax=Chryseobacterium takakiae TaxID=1302685 RepID=A0A1M4UH24_9FLAO|nr:Imm7 family immunity protein [Chryseobacterium takakiae]SHE56009.1 Immunity protein 7 [Chryseobacterium takakiae]